MGDYLGPQCKLDHAVHATCPATPLEANYMKIGLFVIDHNRKQAFEGDTSFPDFASACWYSFYGTQIAFYARTKKLEPRCLP